MSKKNENTRNEPANIVPRQQQTPIQSKSSEELALLLGEQYKMIMQSQTNIAAINGVLEQRRQALAKKAADGE